MRRPGLWVTNGHPGDPSQMLSWRPGSLTCYYDYLGFNGVYPYKANNPEAPIIVRFQHPRNWQQDPAFFARRLGEEVASKWNDLRVMDPYVYFANEMNLHYENGDDNPGNQPRYTTPEFYQQYADWVRLTADVIKNIVPEMKLVTPPFAFGHHEDGSPDDEGNPTEGWAGYDYLAETVRDYFDNILTFHAYWGHGGGSQAEWLYDPDLSTWYAFRWKRVLNLFETRYNLDAKMIIDEAGNFGASDPDFTDQIMYHAEKCLNDRRVLAVTYFLWFDPTNSPGNVLNSWVQGAQNLPDHLNRLRDMPDVPILTETPPEPEPPEPETPETTIRVLFDDGTVQTMALETYLRAVVPAEMPALWPLEALKAQAVAARSYAQYAIEHPRHNNADICTNPAHCQNYDEADIHERGNEAVRQTRGVIARYNGATVNGIFSANCGGHTRNNEDVFVNREGRGYPVPYLRGVPCPATGERFGHGVGFCQHGARVFAEQGRAYDEIIHHYYTGVTFGAPTTERTSNIMGSILDHAERPVAEVRLVLTGTGQTVETASEADGTFRFSNVPQGAYTLTLPDYGLTESTATTPGDDLRIIVTLPAPPPPEIIVEIERSDGLPLIVGNWGRADQAILIRTPKGNLYQTFTGTKPEFGAGGFEFYANEMGIYVLEIEGNRFEVQSKGQTIRLTFRHSDGTPPSEPAGVIEGILRSYSNRPVPNRRIELSSDAASRSVLTDENGYFLFERLPMGRYIVAVAESDIRQDAIITGSNRVALALKFAEPPDTEEWQITLERRDGLPLLVGDIGLPNRPIIVTSPGRVKRQVISGTKPEWGQGGFEIYTTEVGHYIVEFEGQRFTIPINGQFTHVVFERIPGATADKVRLVSDPLSRAQATAMLQAFLATNPDAVDLFEIVEN